MSDIIDFIKKKAPLKKILEAIESGNYNLAKIDNLGNTALILACDKNMQRVALKLIETGKSVPEQINKDGDTALILACLNNMSEVALKLIEMGKSVPEQINKNGYTALILACYNNMLDVALKLIETGKSIPEQINKNGDTALIMACNANMSEVALKLIETGKSLPEQINKNGNTALILACMNNMPDVALKLIETGKSVPEQINKNGNTALSIATNQNLIEVVNLLKNLNFTSMETININNDGFDTINQETKKISEHLKIRDNICFKVNEQYFLTSKKQLKIQLENPSNIKYGCKTAGNTSAYILDSNIVTSKEYLSLSSIISLQILVDTKNIISIINSNFSSNLFSLKPTSIKLPSIISKAFYDGGSGVSADHCQPGKETVVYEIETILPICGIQQMESPEEQTETIKEINIQYKTNNFKLPVSEISTLEEIKTDFLNKLLDENIITSINQNVKFIYKGKMYTDTSIKLTNLENPPFGMTLQAMISPKVNETNAITGGKKTRKIKKTNKNKRMKTNKNKTIKTKTKKKYLYRI